MTRFLSPRLFEFPIRAAQKLAQNGYRFENNGSFTVPGFQRWLALLVAVSATLRVYLSSCSFRLRRGSRKMISRAKRIVRYPRPFPRIKSRISKRGRETKRPVVVNFMQILAFQEFVSFHHREIPARSRAHNGDTRSSSPLWNPTPDVHSLLFIRASFTLKTVRQIALLALYRFDPSFLHYFLLSRLLPNFVKSKFVSRT